MKKLDLDALRVESFEAAGAQAERGTVQARQAVYGDVEASASYLRPRFYTEQRTCTC